jgi:hypothetical protein
MKRLRATVDIYIDMEDDMDEEEAIGLVNTTIDDLNLESCGTHSPVSISEIIQHEIYDTDDECLLQI